uniref:Uncharacterized protein n=1 Tax=mine drainage metagenome TaxID=410659 RepID=E6QGP2_9ZZZZ
MKRFSRFRKRFSEMALKRFNRFIGLGRERFLCSDMLAAFLFGPLCGPPATKALAILGARVRGA